MEYIWAPVGSRPRAVQDSRHDSVFLFGALCAYFAVGAAVIMPAANSEAMSVHLKEIRWGQTDRPGQHHVAAMILQKCVHSLRRAIGGTGIVASRVNLVSKAECKIVGIDINVGMLTIARKNSSMSGTSAAQRSCLSAMAAPMLSYAGKDCSFFPTAPPQ